VAGLIQVEGLRELDRALRELEPAVQKELRLALRAASEPVRARAAALGLAGISGMRRAVNSTWWEMRLGGSAFIYLAPASRNKGGSPRPNLAGILMQKAMRPGLEQGEPAVVAEAQIAINRAFVRVGF
jgi:hypothetical protein